MAIIRTYPKVRFFCGVLMQDAECIPATESALTKAWGEIDFTFGPIPFNFTKYYEQETGTSILRSFYAFKTPFDREELANRKVQSNHIEDELADILKRPVTRPVNLDPGYLCPEKLVLASAKNFAHRIYIGQGIFAEITLFWRHGKFVPLEWTFPDYASGVYDEFFTKLRHKLTKKESQNE